MKRSCCTRASAPVALPGGVADTATSTGFVVGETGVLEAIDLADGRVRWGLPGAAPLIALHGTLFAAVAESGVRVVALDGGTGARQFAAQLLLSGPPPVFFAARLDGGRLMVAWRERAPTQAAQPVARPLFEEEHAAAVDLTSGRVQSIPVAEAAPPTPPPTGVDVATLLLDQTGTVRAWAHGDSIAALSVDGGALILRTFSHLGGAAVSTSTLLPSLPAPGYFRNYRPPDGAHVYLVLCNDRPEGGVPPGGRCRWAVFAVDTGARVADVPFEPSGLPPAPALLGTRLYYAVSAGAGAYLERRRLRAVDVATAATVWEHPLASADRPSPIPGG